MKSNGQLRQRIDCYALTDAGAGTAYIGPRYLWQGQVWGRLIPAAAALLLAAAEAGQELSGIVQVADSAPVTTDGVLKVDNTYYIITAVQHLTENARLKVFVRHVEREKLATDDAMPATLVVTPAAVSIAHGTAAPVLGVATVTPMDAFGFALANRYMTIQKTTSASTLAARVRGNLIDLTVVPGAPATGDVFTITCGTAAVALHATVT
jgi:hypothetical protein